MYYSNFEYNDCIGKGACSVSPNVSSMQGASGEIKWYRPIPETEISSNDGISSEDQNPGY